MRFKIMTGLVLLIVLIATGCDQGLQKDQTEDITSFEECIAAGNPAMESYPRQCRAGDETFTEEIEMECSGTCIDYTPQPCHENGTLVPGDMDECGCYDSPICVYPKMNVQEAIEIANKSDCVEKGFLKDDPYYNEYSQTWWIDLEMRPGYENDGCAPACVVSESSRTAEINWRCTGLIEQ